MSALQASEGHPACEPVPTDFRTDQPFARAARREGRATLRAHVTKEIGALARPAEVRFAEALPKTRSGKIMRRLLRDVASGKETSGDTSTIEDLTVLARLRGEEE